jgi:hypothetical protein
MSLPALKKCCARPGLKRPAQVTSDSATNTEKRFKHEKEHVIFIPYQSTCIGHIHKCY